MPALNPKANWARQHYARLINQGSTRIALRLTTRINGPAASHNPATVVGAVVDGLHNAGATTLNLRGSKLLGRFIAGDLVQVGSSVCSVASATLDNGANKIALPLVAPLPSLAVDNTPVAIFWAADREIAAKVEAWPQNLIDGQMIQVGDLRVQIAALHLKGAEPKPGNEAMISLNGAPREPWTIVAVTPLLEDTWAVAYTLQVRRSA